MLGVLGTRNHEGAPGVGWAQWLNSRGGSSHSLGSSDDGVKEEKAAGKVFSAVGIMCTAPGTSAHRDSGCVGLAGRAGRSRQQAFRVLPWRVGCTEGYADHRF